MSNFLMATSLPNSDQLDSGRQSEACTLAKNKILILKEAHEGNNTFNEMQIF